MIDKKGSVSISRSLQMTVREIVLKKQYFLKPILFFGGGEREGAH
jgi:hypothetical protein